MNSTLIPDERTFFFQVIQTRNPEGPLDPYVFTIFATEHSLPNALSALIASAWGKGQVFFTWIIATVF
jgi:hypothetical protein